MEKLCYFNHENGNMGQIEKVMMSPYKGARKRPVYRAAAMSLDDMFLYHVAVFDTLQAAKNDLQNLCFEIK